MTFMKKGDRVRKEKLIKANIERGIRNRELKAAKVEEAKTSTIAVGRRILKLAVLASTMWCEDCNIALSFRFMSDERVVGLASVFTIRCHQCLREYKIHSDEKVPDTTGKGRASYSVNCKAAMGEYLSIIFITLCLEISIFP